MVEIAMKLVQLMINKLPANEVYVTHQSELAEVVSLYLRYCNIFNILLHSCWLNYNG